jgi:hypothetical protein
MLLPLRLPQPCGRDGQAESFPGKLYSTSTASDLAETERAGTTHIISFTPNGRAFILYDPILFMITTWRKASLVKHNSHHVAFAHELFMDSTRAVQRSGPDRAAFAHASFFRGHPELLGGVRCHIVPVVPRAACCQCQKEITRGVLCPLALGVWLPCILYCTT